MCQECEVQGRKLESNEVRRFVLAGYSIFTILNTETGKRFTFQINKLDAEDSYTDRELYFVKVLTGGDNTSDYTFIGTIFDQKSFRHSRKSRIGEDALSVRAFKWFFPNLDRLEKFPQVEIWHEGYCGRCGAPLTVPESIECGYGPVCAKKLSVAYKLTEAALAA